MTQVISPDDPQYFTETSDGLYDRHDYKIIGKNGESIVVDNWQTVQEVWWNLERMQLPRQRNQQQRERQQNPSVKKFLMKRCFRLNPFLFA